MKVQLTDIELNFCSQVMLARHINARRRSWKMTPLPDNIGIQGDFTGACSEFAVARALNIPWNPSVTEPDTYRGDVGRFQVKSITTENHSLIIRPHDPENFEYILCYYEHKVFTVHLLGWCWGWEGQRDIYWKENVPVPGYFIPQDVLRPIETLRVAGPPAPA